MAPATGRGRITTVGGSINIMQLSGGAYTRERTAATELRTAARSGPLIGTSRPTARDAQANTDAPKRTTGEAGARPPAVAEGMEVIGTAEPDSFFLEIPSGPKEVPP
jgi:hypothetical protein